jgi:hypothetical protein
LTHLDHLPPEKVPGLTQNRDDCLVTATEVGAATLSVVQTLLDDPVVDRLPTVGRLLRLRHKFGDERLEAACKRALHYEDPAYKTVKRILVQGKEDEPLSFPASAPEATAFARSIEELVGDLVKDPTGGASWN